MRKYTKKIRIGDKYIGGNQPILIQSMTNTKTQNINETVQQILRLEEAGCDIVRVAVPDMEAAQAIKQIKTQIHIPIVADIHFDYKLALAAIKNGVDKVRINPGNLGGIERLRAVIEMAKTHDISIRVGVNSGSLDRHIIQKHGGPTVDAMVESTINIVREIEEMNFSNIVIAIKSSDVIASIQSYIKISQITDYPLHIGITESGTRLTGTIKSSVGIGTLLYMGIGDTLRVSLTGDPVDEVHVAKEILKSLNLVSSGVEVISCPTCGRTDVDIISTAESIENAVRNIRTNKKIKVAVMGCAVNGPGEARTADIGVAGGKDEFLLFVKGEILRKIPQDRVIDELVIEIKKLI